MTLTQSYIKSQYISLAPQIRRTLDEIEDPNLTKRTVLYKNLLQVKGMGSRYDTAAIAETVCDILDSQAWLDYVDVDGVRKSCESFPKWCDQVGFDITLAKFAVEEKRYDYVVRLELAIKGELATAEEQGRILAESCRVNPKDEYGRFTSGTIKPKEPQRRPYTDKSYYLRRLHRDRDDPQVAECLALVEAGKLSVTKAAITLGWLVDPNSPKQMASRLTLAIDPEIKEYSVAPITYFQRLHAYAKSHPEILNDILNSPEAD
jgi:hypothetical protein